MDEMTSDADPIDPEAIDRLLQVGGKKLVSKMVAVFLKNGPKRLASANTGLAENNLLAIERAVHSLKSSAGNYGAHALATLADTIETQVENGHSENLSEQLQQLENLYQQVENRLRPLLEEEEK